MAIVVGVFLCPGRGGGHIIPVGGAAGSGALGRGGGHIIPVGLGAAVGFTKNCAPTVFICYASSRPSWPPDRRAVHPCTAVRI